MGSSADEGEIPDAGSVPHSKAASQLHLEGHGVDRHDRIRHDKRNFGEATGPRYANSTGSRHSRSPDRDIDSRSSYSRSRDYRARRFSPEPQMSRRDIDRLNRARRDERDAYSSRGPQASYIDLDRPTSDANGDGYGSYPGGRCENSRKRDRQGEDHRNKRGYADKRFRQRSRSPPGRDRSGLSRGDHGQPITYGHRDSLSRQEGMRRDGYSLSSTQADAAANAARAGHVLSRDTKQLQGSLRHGGPNDMLAHGTVLSAAQSEPNPEPTVQDVEPEVIDEDAEIERRRRRREAILAKSSSATPLLVQALHSSDQASTSPREATQTPDPASPIANSASTMPVHDADSPVTFEFEQIQTIGNDRNTGHDEDGPSAADYDPTADMQEDGRRDEMRQGHVVLHGQVVADSDNPSGHAEEFTDAAIRQGQAPAADQDDDDDDDFDMFAEDFDDDKYAAANPTQAVQQTAAAAANAPADGAILEGDDKEGYYKIRPGEMLDGRYQLQVALGKGMFSGVAQAIDMTTSKLVAIKIMRNNDALRKGGYTEIAILQKLNAADPDDRKHIVRFEHHFDFKGHLCLAFEHLSMNLREVLRKFGNNVGINLDATRAYAHQIFVALAHMRRCNIIHADLKPDNILVSEKRNVVKICDLGTAIDRSDAATAQDAVTPYLVSRFYRAPELILGMPYDYGVDMWSVGCTLYELYTGKILFTGDSNNQMLRTIMETRGKIMPKMFKKGQLSGMHFDDMGRFLSTEMDKFGKAVVRTLPMTKPTRDLRARLMAACGGGSDTEVKDAGLFLDLLEQCLALNPDKRIQPAEALKHPFFTSRMGAGKR